MAKLNAANNAQSLLNGAITDVATSMTVLDGSIFPDTPFAVTIEDEIIYVVAKSGNIFSSLLRGQEDTTAAAHATGVSVENRMTAGMYDDLATQEDVNDLAGSGRTTETVKGNAAELAAHKAETATDEDGVHGLEVETGLWTPSIVGATVAGTNTYAVQFGKYVKENKKVTLKFDVEMSNKDANMSGSVRIVGLPFAADINARYFNVIIVLLTPGLLDKSIVARVDGAVMTLAYGSGSWVVLDATTIVDKSVFAGEIIYFTK